MKPMSREMNNPQDLTSPSPRGSGEAFSYGPLATQRTPIGFAARLLKHVAEYEQTQARARAATAALRQQSTPATRAEARDALSAHVKSARRLARSRMRMQECLEAEGHHEPWFEEGSS